MQNILSDKGIGQTAVAKYAKPTVKAMRKKRVFLLIAGVVIGIVNGLFGAGGGMLTVPCLTYIDGLDQKTAHATAIAIILPLCLTSSIVYSSFGSYDMGIVLPTILGVMVGGVVGAQLLKKLSNDVLTFLFYGIMLFAGLKMFFAK